MCRCRLICVSDHRTESKAGGVPEKKRKRRVVRKAAGIARMRWNSQGGTEANPSEKSNPPIGDSRVRANQYDPPPDRSQCHAWLEMPVRPEGTLTAAHERAAFLKQGVGWGGGEGARP